MPHSEPNTLAAIAYASRRPGSDSTTHSPALFAQLASPTPISPCNEQQTTNNEQSHNPQSTIRNPQSLDLSSVAGLDRVRLVCAYAEQDLIDSFESRRTLAPSDPTFSARLSEDTLTLWRVTSVRKAIITLDDHFEYRAAQREHYAAQKAQCEAEQARLEAEEAAQAELTRQAIDRAEELLTRLAADDAYFQKALAATNTDLALEFARLRNPEAAPAPSAPTQKQIDSAAHGVMDKLLYGIQRAHPHAPMSAFHHLLAVDRLAAADRGEPLPPAPTGDEDEDDEDDWADDDWPDDEDENDDDDDTGSADALVRRPASADQSAPAINKSPGARASSPAFDLACDPAPSFEDNAEDAEGNPIPPNSRTAPIRRLNPLAPFNPQATLRKWEARNSQSGAPKYSIRTPQSTIRNCAVPTCPTATPRRLQSFIQAHAATLDARNSVSAPQCVHLSTPAPAPAPSAKNAPPTDHTIVIFSPAPVPPTFDIGHLTLDNHPAPD